MLLHFLGFLPCGRWCKPYITRKDALKCNFCVNEDVNVLLLASCRRRRELLLRPGTPHETAPHPNDPQPAAQLRTVQEDGNLCKSPPPLPNDTVTAFWTLFPVTDVLCWCFLNVFSEAAQGDGGGDDKVPQRRLHQVPALHPAGQHVRVQQADAAL